MKTYFKKKKTRLKRKALKDLKIKVVERDNFQCLNPLCGRADSLTVHHLKKLSQGGEDVIENMFTLCMECHHLIEVHKLDEGFLYEYQKKLYGG